MVRGKSNLPKVRRVISKVLEGMPFKQIEFEENVAIRRIVWLKKKYIRETKILRLNALGISLMNEDQFKLPLLRKPTRILRVDHQLRNGRKLLKS